MPNLSTPCPRLVASGSDGKRTGLWTTQTARNLLMRWNDALAGSGICTPPRAPKTNAGAERWVRTIIWNERQLRSPLDEYTDHYNAHRPQRGLTRAPNDNRRVLGTFRDNPLTGANAPLSSRREVTRGRSSRSA